MLSDEEKKAIQYLNKYCDTDLLYEPRHYNYIKMIIRLVGKQSKEIEELNKENTRQHELIGNIHKKWKDKIKAKVIEVKNRPLKDEFITASQGKLNTIIDMESLLEKE